MTDAQIDLYKYGNNIVALRVSVTPSHTGWNYVATGLPTSVIGQVVGNGIGSGGGPIDSWCAINTNSLDIYCGSQSEVGITMVFSLMYLCL